MDCERCCYFGYSEGVEYEHCCFHEFGHTDDEVAPCDDPDFDDYEEPGDIDDDFGFDPYEGCYTYDC